MNITNSADIRHKIADLIGYGRKEITTRKELSKFPIGSLISYMSNDNILKLGGYLLSVESSWFIYITYDLNIKVRVRFENITKMFVGDVNDVYGDYISMMKAKQTPTNYHVKIGKRIVFYGVSSYKCTRFKSTAKYERTLQWYNYFHNK